MLLKKKCCKIKQCFYEESSVPDQINNLKQPVRTNLLIKYFKIDFKAPFFNSIQNRKR